MGNAIEQQQSNFNTVMNNLKKSKLSPKRLALRPEQKYKDSLLQALTNCKLSNHLKANVRNCIINIITPVEIIETVSVIMMLLRNEISHQAYKSVVEKSKVQSRHVIINFNPQKLKKYKPISEQSAIKNGDKVKHTHNILKAEINKIHHPINKLTKVFTDYIKEIFILNSLQHEDIEPQLIVFMKTQKNYQQYEQLVRNQCNKWCSFIIQSCFTHYKNWVINYTAMKEQNYKKWVCSIVMEQMWGINQGYLYQVVSHIIQKYKKILDIPEIGHIEFVKPQFFHIDEPLQIEGNFFGSIFEMSQFGKYQPPSALLNHLTNIKTAICTDIDKYYHLEQKLSKIIEQENKIVYEVNSDNILGIIAYILYRVRIKIQDIDKQCILLRIVYGENVYYSKGQSSYMLTTIIAAIEYLESQEFKEEIKNHQTKINDKKEGITFSSSFQSPLSINIEESYNNNSEQNHRNKKIQKVIF